MRILIYFAGSLEALANGAKKAQKTHIGNPLSERK